MGHYQEDAALERYRKIAERAKRLSERLDSKGSHLDLKATQAGWWKACKWGFLLAGTIGLYVGLNVMMVEIFGPTEVHGWTYAIHMWISALLGG